MEELKLANHNTTLVDSVEESLISYFKEQGLRPGCSIPNEMELAASLGVGRAVLREALSRFKMTGMIVSRTKKGMVLGEPSLLGGMKRCINPLLMNESTLCDILEFRVALEIGISDNIFRNLTDAGSIDIQTRQKILRRAVSILLQAGVAGDPPVIGHRTREQTG